MRHLGVVRRLGGGGGAQHDGGAGVFDDLHRPQSVLATLRSGPATQTTPLGWEIWAAVRELTARGEQVVFQWVLSHYELPGNNRADELANEASALPQENAPVDGRTVHRAAARVARDQWIQS